MSGEDTRQEKGNHKAAQKKFDEIVLCERIAKDLAHDLLPK